MFSCSLTFCWFCILCFTQVYCNAPMFLLLSNTAITHILVVFSSQTIEKFINVRKTYKNNCCILLKEKHKRSLVSYQQGWCHWELRHQHDCAPGYERCMWGLSQCCQSRLMCQKHWLQDADRNPTRCEIWRSTHSQSSKLRLSYLSQKHNYCWMICGFQ